MNKRAYLRSNEGIYYLSPKITIIGRESCDFIIQNITIDPQQAVIEFLEDEDCFVLKDLNSTHGSYVNECRIQNASVRLAEGDILKFGFSVGLYEFHSENIMEDDDGGMTTTYTQLPVNQKQARHLNMIQSQPQTSAPQISLPVISYANAQPVHQRHTISGPGYRNQLPRAPSSNLRILRPQSANGQDRRQITPTAHICSSSSSLTYRRGSISGPQKQFLPDHSAMTLEEPNNVDMRNEIDRLRYSENQYRDKVDSLTKLNNELLNSQRMTMSNEVYNQMKGLTEEVSLNHQEIDRLQHLMSSMKENSNIYDTNTSNNDADIGMLRHELEKIRKDLQISNGLVISLQKDLSNKEEAVKKLNSDIEKLNHDLTEKDVSISSLMSKLSRLKDVEEQIQGDEIEKQDRERELISLKHKLKSAEISCKEKEEQIAPLKKFIEELKYSEKLNNEAVNDLSQKLEETRALLSELQKSEALIRVDAVESGNKFEKFRSKMLHLALSTPGFKATEKAMKDDEIIDIMKELLNSKVEHDRRMCEKQKVFETEVQKHRQFLQDLQLFEKNLKENLESLRGGERISNKIQKVITSIKSFPSNENFYTLRDVVTENLQNEMEFLSNLESCISDAGPELANLTLSECFKRIIERSIDAVEGRAKTADELTQLQETYEEQLKRLKKEHEEDVLKEVSQTMERENARYEEALKEVIEEESIKAAQLSKECDQKLKEYENEIECLKKVMTEKETECKDSLEEMSKKCEKFDLLEQKLKEMTESKSILEQTLCEQFDTINKKWKSEIEGYKEEITQHSITIRSLNERLLKLNAENKDMHKKMDDIKSEDKKKETRKIIEVDENNPVLVNEMNNHNATIANLERCISALRHENVFLKNKNREHEDTMKGLNMDLAGAEARLSDLKGELSESQKKEIDRLNVEIQKLEDDCNEVRIQLSKMTAIVDNLCQEIETLKMENKQLGVQLEEERLKVQDKENKIQDLEANILFEKENWLRHINEIEQEGRITSELAATGSQCRGDRHVQIIDAQKMALSELRQKIKTIEITRIPNELGGLFENAFSTMFTENVKSEEEQDMTMATKIEYTKVMAQIKETNIAEEFDYFPKLVKNANVPEITHQMMQLKKELAELRAKQTMKEVAPRGVASLTDIMPHKNVTRKSIPNSKDANKDRSEEENAIISKINENTDKSKANKQLQFDLNVAKASIFDLKENLEHSEATYLNLAKQLVEALDLERFKGARPFENLSHDAKEYLHMERDESCGIIVQKIKVMKEMIKRKDELLQSYEIDLVKLKQAEDLTTKTQAQLEHIVQQSRSKSEEVELLRETLNRTKDILNQERRVNNAIKQNKHYISDKSLSQSRSASDSPKYHCPPEDISGKDKEIQRKRIEKVKRKDYEIKTLKSELYNKEKELSQATNRLYTLETTMGIKSEEPVT